MALLFETQSLVYEYISLLLIHFSGTSLFFFKCFSLRLVLWAWLRARCAVFISPHVEKWGQETPVISGETQAASWLFILAWGEIKSLIQVKQTTWWGELRGNKATFFMHFVCPWVFHVPNNHNDSLGNQDTYSCRAWSPLGLTQFSPHFHQCFDIVARFYILTYSCEFAHSRKSFKINGGKKKLCWQFIPLSVPNPWKYWH